MPFTKSFCTAQVSRTTGTSVIMAVAAMGRAMAFVMGRDYVIPEDVRRVFRDTVSHRLIFMPQAEAIPDAHPLKEILRATPAPQIQ